MDKKLIFDVGMHQCQDTDYYLKRDYRVIGIDADAYLINSAKNRYDWYVRNNMLIALNYAISDKEEKVYFNISNMSIWNSLKPEIANRHNMLKEQILVQTRTLPSIFLEYGVPYYCKIDIEGYDNICLNTLFTLHELPTFISVESECVGEGEWLVDEEALQTLNTLRDLGYTRFKLIDQSSLASLSYRQKFYYDDTRLFGRLMKYLSRANVRRSIQKRMNYTFTPGSSGPFGNDLAGVWMTYEMAKATLIRHRRDFFNLSKAHHFGFWCDWHATF